MRMPRSSSMAAEVTNPFSAAFTVARIGTLQNGVTVRHTAGQRERAAIIDIARAKQDKVHLPHELVFNPIMNCVSVMVANGP